MLSACATEFAELNIGKFSSEPSIADETASEEDIVELRFNDTQLRKLQVGLVSQDVLEGAVCTHVVDVIFETVAAAG